MAAPLRAAIIGCGVIGPTHAESLLAQEGVELRWACDLVEEKAAELARSYDIPRVSTDYHEVLADPQVDCVSVCTDHASHAPIGIDALEAGKHVLCEKALAPTREAMDRMLATHERHLELVFSGVFQHRFDPVNRTLRRLAEEGAFGQLLTAGVQVRCLRTCEYYAADEWRGTWAREGGSVLINQAIHFIDVLLWIVGGAEAVCGTHANLTHDEVIETEDSAVAAVRFRRGALGTIEAIASSHLDWEPTVSLHGTRGSVEVRNGSPVKLAFEDPAREEEVRRELTAQQESPGVKAGKSYYGTGHPAQIADFVDAIREGRQPFVTAHQARHAVDTVLAIYRSQREGGWVEC